MPEEWILMLPQVFEKDHGQSLWWRRTKLIVKTWDEFKSEFTEMYGSDSNKHQSLEKLLNRRQRASESFQRFAFEMDMQYRKVFHSSTSIKQEEVLKFVAERSLPALKPHLLTCNAKTLVELVNLARSIETSQEKSYPQRSQQQSQSIKNADYSEKHYNGDRRNSDKSEKSNKDKEKKNKPSESRKSNSKKSQLSCEHCPDSTNHETDSCFKIIGYPDKKQKNKQQQHSVKTATIAEVDCASENGDRG